MIQDVRYALRSLRHNTRTAVVAVLTLAVGIGGATAVFSVVDAVILRPLPFADADRLLRLYETTPDGAPFSFSAGNYLDLVDHQRGFDGLAAYREVSGAMVLTGHGDPQRMSVVPITATLTGVLGVRPVLGRMFTHEEDRSASTERLVVLSHSLWRDRFSGDPDALGRTVELDAGSYTILGVMPPGFDFPGAADAWIPLRAVRDASRDDKDLAVVGRLSAGATLTMARGELREFARRLSEAHPESNRGWSVGAVTFSEWIVAPRFRQAVWVLSGAVGLLLLLACANVANLLVARGAARVGELRIRAALGAERWRLARQLFTESAVLGVLGTGAGVLVASWTIAAVQALGDGRIPRLEQVSVNHAVLGFACAAGLVSCLLFGLFPAFHGARVDLRAAMDEGARSTPRGRRLRQALVMSEVALALLLLIGAGLLANSFIRLLSVDPGFDMNGLMTLTVKAPAARYGDDRVTPFFARLVEHVRAAPGVTSAAATSQNPFHGPGFRNNVTPEDRAAEAPPSGLVQAGWRSVTPGFFETMRIPLIRGRTFTSADGADAARVVIVSASLARQLWPGGDAIGKRIYWGGTTGRTRTVVGVAGDYQDVNPGAESTPMLFVPHAQVPLLDMTVVLRTSSTALVTSAALQAVIRQADATLPVPPLEEIRRSRLDAAAGHRFNLSLLGAFAAVALVLSITGVYAMLAFTIVERRREIAVRIALGATPSAVVRLLVGGGFALALAGAAIGLAASVALTRVLQSLLYEVTPTDPWTFAGATVVLLLAAAAACYVPARKTGRGDPLEILREG
jgi:predicted permease